MFIDIKVSKNKVKITKKNMILSVWVNLPHKINMTIILKCFCYTKSFELYMIMLKEKGSNIQLYACNAFN